MKRLMWRVAQGYLVVGSALGFILWGSYAWGATWGMPPGGSLLSNVVAGGGMLFIGALGGLVRTFLWLPSLLLWASDANRDPFVYWLATGLLVERIGS